MPASPRRSTSSSSKGSRLGNTVTFSNTGKEFHHAQIFPLLAGKTADDAKTFFASQNPSGPPPFDFTKVVGLEVNGPGQSQVVSLDLVKGDYVEVCFINDKTGGPPHFVKGMLQPVTVS